MRILANYSLKHNEEAFSVTFETLGDVPREKAPLTADELFTMAREAVQRQLEGPQRSKAGPEPARGPIRFKDPDLPATKRQKALICRLYHNRGRKVAENIHSLTMAQASEIIGRMRG